MRRENGYLGRCWLVIRVSVASGNPKKTLEKLRWNGGRGSERTDEDSFTLSRRPALAADRESKGP